MDMTPRQIVAYLDDYIIGQKDAKKTIALALRNRYRRMRVEPNLQEEIMPKNILMIGSTGVGKTEIARRNIRRWFNKNSFTFTFGISAYKSCCFTFS